MAKKITYKAADFFKKRTTKYNSWNNVKNEQNSSFSRLKFIFVNFYLIFYETFGAVSPYPTVVTAVITK